MVLLYLKKKFKILKFSPIQDDSFPQKIVKQISIYNFHSIAIHDDDLQKNVSPLKAKAESAT